MLTKRIFPGWISQKCSQTLQNTSRQLSTEERDVIVKNIGDKGIIILNRPKTMNSLTFPMIRKIYPTLVKWENEKTLVIVKGSGDKAFSSGGDLKAMAEAALKDNKEGHAFFKAVYRNNGLIGSYKIPYISFIDGIVMGGGVGLSVHGHYRIATERTLFAMPETQIGLFPDTGCTYFFPRLGGRLGWYLALAGIRLKGADLLKAGIATHFTDSSNLPSIEKALLQCSNENDIENILTKFQTEDKKEFSLAPYIEQINHCFSAPTVEEIIIRLEKDGSEWAEDTLKLLSKMSPTSLKIAHKGLELGKNMNLLECLQMEYRMSVNCVDNHDFREGVRALLIDKNQKPQWKPSTLKEVTDDFVNSYFIKLPDEEELIH